jgi:hypothetical protein
MDDLEPQTDKEQRMIFTQRDMAIAKIAWSQGYEYGHHHTVEGQYAPPKEYDYDILMEQIADGTFDHIPDKEADTLRAEVERLRAALRAALPALRVAYKCGYDLGEAVNSYDIYRAARELTKDIPAPAAGEGER